MLWRRRGSGGGRFHFRSGGAENHGHRSPLEQWCALDGAEAAEPFDDLFQVASLGLVKAVDRFDPDRGAEFSSFAVPTILGELKRHFRDKGRSVHLPRGMQELVLKVQGAEAKLSSQSGRSPSVIDIAQYLQLETEQVLDALEAIAAQRVTSLDAPVAEDGSHETSTAHDKVGAEDERYELIETTASLGVAVKQLRRDDREVLALRVRKDLKQHEIAERVGVSQMQVSRILRRVNDQLRQELEREPYVARERARRIA